MTPVLSHEPMLHPFSGKSCFTENLSAPSADCMILSAYWTGLEVRDNKTAYCLRNILESFLVDFGCPNKLSLIASLTNCSILLT